MVRDTNAAVQVERGLWDGTMTWSSAMEVPFEAICGACYLGGPSAMAGCGVTGSVCNFMDFMGEGKAAIPGEQSKLVGRVLGPCGPSPLIWNAAPSVMWWVKVATL